MVHKYYTTERDFWQVGQKTGVNGREWAEIQDARGLIGVSGAGRRQKKVAVHLEQPLKLPKTQIIVGNHLGMVV